MGSAVLLWGLFALQSQDEGRPIRPEKGLHEQGQPELDASCEASGLFGGSELERAAYCRLFERKYASLRRLADRALDQDSTSFRAHYLMGMALHLGDANLPKARYHLETAERLFVARIGQRPDPASEVSSVLRSILVELVYVHGEMDAHEAKIAYVDKLKAQLGVDYEPLKAWPLMKLGRFDDARQVALRATESEMPYFRAVGRTALCAVESERRNREEAYRACRAAAERWLTDPTDGAVELTNAGAAAEEMLRLEEAERYYVTATRRIPEGSVNPYGRLVLLFLRQGRLGEAVSSLRAMKAYRAERPGAHLDQQDDAEASTILASLLLVTGRVEAAERISGRALSRPDRKGTSSAASDQALAGAALLDRATKRTRAYRLQEQIPALSFWEAQRARFEVMVLRWRAWKSGRLVREVLSDSERLAATLRPEVPGSLEGPEWLDFDVVSLLGPGVVASVVRDNRQEEVLPEVLSGPIFDLFEVEAHVARGDWTSAMQVAESVRNRLPTSLALMRGRAALRAAQAAERLGAHDRAKNAWREVLMLDPSLIRRLGARLPVRFSTRGVSEELARAIRRSPRLRLTDWGFELQLSEQGARLATEDGQLLKAVPWAEDAAAGHVANVMAFHDGLLAPKVNLTQFDVQSLDGMLGGGRDVSKILDELSAD
ncbi:MAG: hypothetical protein ACFB9M_07215 [Myxococcota bacterium]